MAKRISAPAISSLLIFAAAACAPADDTIDRIFDPCEPFALSTASSEQSDSETIRAALSLWNELAGTRLSLVEPGMGAVSIDFQKAAPAQHGVYDDERALIFVNRTLDRGQPLLITIAHEVGHAMGLVHVERSSERRSVMVPGNTETPPGEFDRESLVSVWGECL